MVQVVKQEVHLDSDDFLRGKHLKIGFVPLKQGLAVQQSDLSIATHCVPALCQLHLDLIFVSEQEQHRVWLAVVGATLPAMVGY